MLSVGAIQNLENPPGISSSFSIITQAHDCPTIRLYTKHMTPVYAIDTLWSSFYSQIFAIHVVKLDKLVSVFILSFLISRKY